MAGHASAGSGNVRTNLEVMEEPSIHPDRPIGQQQRGPVVMRRNQVQQSTSEQRLLDSRGPSDWVHTDPWRVLRIQSEFIEGFGMLAELGPAISVFGSARTKPDDPMYAAAEETGRKLVEAGYAVITGGGPGRDGGGEQGRVRGRRACRSGWASSCPSRTA